MRFSKLNIFLSLIILLPLFIKGQTAFDDLNSIRKRYYDSNQQINYTLKILYFNKSNLKLAIDSNNASYSFYKNNSFMDIEGVKQIINGKYEIVINKNNKSISLSNSSRSNKSFDFTKNYFDSISNSKNITIQKFITKPLSKIRFIFKEQAIDSVVLTYNQNNFLLKELEIYYNRPLGTEYDFPPVVKMKYLHQEINEKTDFRKYNIDNYVTVENIKATLKQEYKEYSLINNLRF